MFAANQKDSLSCEVCKRQESIPICAEAKGVTHGGAFGSENVGTSNHKEGEIPSRRKTKVSFAMIISEGLVGPKEMTKVGSDGHKVNIP